MSQPDKEFVYQLTDWQNRLFGYLVTLLGNPHDARDVLQETNLVLWQKTGDFQAGTDFGAWARRCAYYQTLAFLRDRKRDRHFFDDDVLALFANEDTGEAHDENERRLALRDCLACLPDKHRQMIDRRYREEVSIRQLAVDHGKNESALKMAMMRIREVLRQCIQSKLKEATP
jgi:RNA polymerase sigma-70 factor, ECF subfamily